MLPTGWVRAPNQTDFHWFRFAAYHATDDNGSLHDTPLDVAREISHSVQTHPVFSDSAKFLEFWTFGIRKSVSVRFSFTMV